jgi:hypothetical protein
MLSIFMVFYLFTYRPMLDSVDFRVELLNELAIIYFADIIFLYTAMVPKVSQRYELGWIFIILLGLLFFVDLAIFFWNTVCSSIV